MNGGMSRYDFYCSRRRAAFSAIAFALFLIFISGHMACCLVPTSKIKADFYRQMEIQIEAVEAGEEAQ